MRLGTRRSRYRALAASVTDDRSGRVLFVSHCLLNQNTRYLGGAACPGVVSAAIDAHIRDGTGLVQMPCPEQRVLGGVLKTRMLWLLEHPRLARAAPVLLPAVRGYLRRRYARIARTVAAEVDDYRTSGLTVTGIIGVAGSPSCGVHSTLDLTHAATAVAARRNRAITVGWMNTAVVRPATRPGTGLFIEELGRALKRRGVEVALSEQALPPPP